MAEIFASSTTPIAGLNEIKLLDQETPSVYYKSSFQDVIEALFQKGIRETDTNHLTVIVIDGSENSNKHLKLDQLSYEDKVLLIKYYFSHLNPVILNSETITDAVIEHINETSSKLSDLIHDRISRLQTWTGTATTSVDDEYNEKLDTEISDIISTMSSVLYKTASKSKVSLDRLTHIKDTIIDSIDFISLLSKKSTSHFLKLCNLVGHWSFPAHELSNDDLAYCVFLIIKYALEQVKQNIPEVYEEIALSNNELLGLIFMVRDAYKSGNPFHNFRHAVDVLQACFHYVIRLGYLPLFTQFQTDPRADELICLHSEKFGNAVELIPMKRLASSELEDTNLNLVQTLSLLLAALGHDIGHPGVTNQFLIKHSLPTSLIFNEKSVLELFHTSVFLNRILVINWPQFLVLNIDKSLNLSVKDLIITCILATDMAEHFDYIDRLNKFNYIHHHMLGTSSTRNSCASTCSDSFDVQNKTNQVKLVSSLLIKCADISNVTRPLRVSSQWALVLSREFEEVLKLEQKISNNNQHFDIHYEKIPEQMDEVIESSKSMPGGQIFFINTFAENLFNNIVELLPPLKFTGDIVKDNKEFWKSREKSSKCQA